MDSVDPKVLDLMDKALAAAFNMRVMARSGRKKKEGDSDLFYFFCIKYEWNHGLLSLPYEIYCL